MVYFYPCRLSTKMINSLLEKASDPILRKRLEQARKRAVIHIKRLEKKREKAAKTTAANVDR